MVVWQRPQHRGVDDREDRGRDADAERQREHGDDRRPSLARKLAEAVANVEEERVHQRPVRNPNAMPRGWWHGAPRTCKHMQSGSVVASPRGRCETTRLPENDGRSEEHTSE